jgi:hypothetical protein
MAINLGSVIGLVESLINTILGLQTKAASNDHAAAAEAHRKLQAISDAASNA